MQALGGRARHRVTEIQSMEQLLSRTPAAPGNAKDSAPLEAVADPAIVRSLRERLRLG
jgi:phosphoribosyl-dephospho-CoA transferase